MKDAEPKDMQAVYSSTCVFIHLASTSFLPTMWQRCAKLLGALKWPCLGGRVGGLFCFRILHQRPQIETLDILPKWSFILVVNMGNWWSMSILEDPRVLVTLLWHVLIPRHVGSFSRGSNLGQGSPLRGSRNGSDTFPVSHWPTEDQASFPPRRKEMVCQDKGASPRSGHGL